MIHKKSEERSLKNLLLFLYFYFRLIIQLCKENILRLKVLHLEMRYRQAARRKGILVSPLTDFRNHNPKH